MAKLVTVESGSIVPLPGTSELYDGGTILTRKTQLIVDGNDITLICKDGWKMIFKNHQLELNERSNYKEQPVSKRNIFFINLRSKLVEFRLFFKRFINPFAFFFSTRFQIIFSKYHISNYDLGDLDSYLARRILPKIKAYRERYLAREVREYPPLLFQENQSFHNVPSVHSEGEMSVEEKAWVAVMDENIFAVRWLLEGKGIGDNPIKTAFFKDYYSEFVSMDEDKAKY